MPRPPTIIFPGDKFGYLSYVKDAAPLVYAGSTVRRIICECECKKVVTVVWQNVRRGMTTSCGCHSRDSQYTHGLSKHVLYKTWAGMIARCYETDCISFDNYGGRGITVCKEWRSNPDGLTAFVIWAEKSGYTTGLELDRKNNDLNYSPDNCRWVTRRKNAGNRRDSIRVTYQGVEYTFTDFWEAFGTGISYRAAAKRLGRGYKPIDAVTVPSKK